MSERVTTATAVRRKRCSDCDELKDDVIGRQCLCSDCEQDKGYCKICDWFGSPDGDSCRHVGWSNEFGCNCGCGTWDIEADAHRESFDLLLSKLAPLKADHYDKISNGFVLRPLLPTMLALIAANNFWTYWHGPLIGSPPDLEMRFENGLGENKRVVSLYDLHASQQEAWGWKAIDALQLGMAWLTSLDDKSVEANKITARWIEEFLIKDQTQ